MACPASFLTEVSNTAGVQTASDHILDKAK